MASKSISNRRVRCRQLLRVVDGVSNQPLLIPRFADVPKSATRGARHQPAAFPRNARAEANRASEQTERQHFTQGSPPGSWTTAQYPEARSKRRRPQRASNRLAEKGSERFTVEEFFSTGTGTLESRVNKLFTILSVRFRPLA